MQPPKKTILEEVLLEVQLERLTAQLAVVEREIEAARISSAPHAYVAALRARRVELRKALGLPPLQNQFRNPPHHITDEC